MSSSLGSGGLPAHGVGSLLPGYNGKRALPGLRSDGFVSSNLALAARMFIILSVKLANGPLHFLQRMFAPSRHVRRCGHAGFLR
jgi:hypothetical protein